MFRKNDLSHFVATIGAAIAGPIMNDLGSDQGKGVARALLDMLDRLSSDLVDGDRSATGALAPLAEIEQEFAAISGVAVARPAAGSPLEQMDTRLLALQDEVEQPLVFDLLVERLAASDPAARDWMRRISELLTTLNGGMERSFAAQAYRPKLSLGGTDPLVLRDTFEAYLTRRYPELPPQPIVAFSQVPGGHSKLTALFSLKPNEVLPEHLALRVDIAHSITGARLVEEYPILERVFALGLPVPRPILLELDPSILGGAFVMLTQVRDAKFGGSPFPEDRRRDGCALGPEFGVEAARLLARLHGGTLEAAGPKPELAAARDDYVQEQLLEWRTLDKPPLSISLDLGVAWMLAHPLPAERPACLLHGDFGAHNVLTRDGHLAALLDWELSKRGDPSEDLAQVKMMLVGDLISWEDFAASYVAAGGPAAACDPHAVAYYQLMTYLKHGLNQTRLRNRFLRRERTDLSAAMVASHYQDRITLYQARALDEATSLTF